MPEGDSIRKIAAAMRPVLVGKQLASVRAGGVEHGALAGQTVVDVEPHGKHLLITTDRGVVIRSHLGMNGRWWRHPASAPPRSAAAASLVVATADDILVCSKAMQVEIRDRRDPRMGAAIRRLGPDILGESFDTAEAIARARRLPPDTPAASMLLDQGVACGIGNIYKCEALWLERRAPSTPIAALDDAALAALLGQARELMQASVAGRRRPFQVYRRAGEPCPRCRTRIASEVEGGELRRTYWCPGCQA
jgi:endonuclease-8